MKSINFLIAAIMFSLTVADAQDSVQGTTFGIQGGINFQNINGTDAEGRTMDNGLVTRFHAGVDAEIPVAPDFYFQPGLLFATKGAKKQDVFLGITFTSKVYVSYIELLLHFIYKPLLGDGHLILGLGPYLAYGIGGTAQVEGNGTTVEKDIEFKSTVSLSDDPTVFYLKAFDAGADIFAGYEFSNRLSFQLIAQWGLIKINPSIEGLSDNQASYKNTGFGLSLGYHF